MPRLPTLASKGFAPIARADARVLLLGSLPGQKSLADHQYYAHPQNAFWPIMRELFGVNGCYDERCMGLVTKQVAVWDVLRASVRPGSLDADIRHETAQINDFETFLKIHINIELIAFNGKKAEQLFRRMAPSRCTEHLRLVGLPSTSPAFASMSYARKLDAWRAGLSLVSEVDN